MEMFGADGEGEGDSVCGVILVFATKSVVSTASTISSRDLMNHYIIMVVGE